VKPTVSQADHRLDFHATSSDVLSIHTPFFGYHLDPAPSGAHRRATSNGEIAAMARPWPTRFAGLATPPMEEINTAIDELSAL
jgi:predicted TIM-barrel fold metal-dependent hydrolase